MLMKRGPYGTTNRPLVARTERDLRPSYARLDKNRLRPRGSDRSDRKLRAGQFRNSLQIPPSLGRKLLPASRIVRGGLPTRELQIDRLAFGKQLDVVGNMIV